MISHRCLRFALPALAAVSVGALATPAARAEDTILAIPGQNVLFLSRYIADDQHLWSKEGLNVKILDIIGIGSMNAVIAGSADFSMGSGPTVTRAWAKGQKVSALLTAISQSGQSIVIRKDIADAAHFDPNAPITERGKVLKGRTIAIGGVGAIPDVVLKVIAKDAGVAPGDVIAPPMQPPEFMAAFASNPNPFYDLGRAIRERIDAGALKWPVLPAGECIRATALGASEYSVQLSGNTSYISKPGGLLPRRNQSNPSTRANG